MARPTDEHGDHAELELAHEAGLGDVVELVADHSLERDVGPQSVETLEQWAEPVGLEQRGGIRDQTDERDSRRDVGDGQLEVAADRLPARDRLPLVRVADPVSVMAVGPVAGVGTAPAQKRLSLGVDPAVALRALLYGPGWDRLLT